MIYFDNSATTKPSDRVLTGIHNILSSEEYFGNPGSLHRLGISSDKKYKECFTRVAKQLNCTSDELYFTSCGTEGANTAIMGYISRNKRAGKTIISTRTEHKCTLETLEKLSKEGYTIKYVSVLSNGKPNLDELENLIDEDTALMCFTHVNNETGSILPLEDIVELRDKKNRNTAIYLDCVQSLGKLDINLKQMRVDMATFSGHKIHSVKGVGVLFIRKSLKVDPLIIGGGQQDGMRSGTQSLYLADAFATALEEANENRVSALERVSEINTYLRSELSKRNATINSPSDGLPFVLNVAFEGFQSETMLHCLENYDIFVSTVSACSSKSKKVSYVLTEMGINRKIAENSVRLSFSRFNSLEEAKHFIVCLDEIYSLFLVRKMR